MYMQQIRPRFYNEAETEMKAGTLVCGHPDPLKIGSIHMETTDVCNMYILVIYNLLNKSQPMNILL